MRSSKAILFKEKTCRLANASALILVKKIGAKKAEEYLTKKLFSDIYKNNSWGDKCSGSGPGSNLEETKIIRSALPGILKRFSIKTVLDIPCGDFYWMSRVNLSDVDYIGADVVKDVIDGNKKNESTKKRFLQINLVRDSLPAVDLIFCRDCLVHLSNEDVISALKNICKSESKYLMTTTFCEQKINKDIITGRWRMINFENPPFSLPKPIFLLNEEHPDSAYKDKSLGIWLIRDLKAIIDKY